MIRVTVFLASDPLISDSLEFGLEIQCTLLSLSFIAQAPVNFLVKPSSSIFSVPFTAIKGDNCAPVVTYDID